LSTAITTNRARLPRRRAEPLISQAVDAEDMRRCSMTGCSWSGGEKSAIILQRPGIDLHTS
jgi:hypothetical protein